MPSKSEPILAFDVYGTLLSTESIAKALAEHVGEEKGREAAKTWRRIQLEYTWRCNSMGLFFDFMMVTRRSFAHTLLETKINLTESQTASVIDSYTHLSAFPDVAPLVERLRANPAINPVIFTNGTRAMLEANLSPSSELSSSVFSDTVVVEDVRKYKPAPETYHHLAQKFGVGELDIEGLDNMWLVSSNSFDVVGARAVGMKAIWVDRAGEGWKDNLMPGSDMRTAPTQVVRSLEEVVGVVKNHCQQK